ncbi:MAG TPA: isoprenylcysteine carboxylmethyltransferase family protein [Cyclobacteriaceae bacterium]|nr:isoprenylcysteine carboxylmethyltransferase family protein [Cyclobacteriaceae bacterium]
MTSLLLRNLFFTILQPGMVAGFIPYWIIRNQLDQILEKQMGIFQFIAVLLFITGFVVTIACILRFAFEGKGTLSPADETKQLVIGGLYRYSRNPMYVGVMLMLIGEALLASSKDLWIYAAIIFGCFHLFILIHEEPRLQRDFGDQYTQYRQKVRRWL